MSQATVSATMNRFRGEVGKLCRALADLARAEESRAKNLARIPPILTRIAKAADALDQAPVVAAEVRAYLQQIRTEVEREKQKRQQAFGGQLAEQLEQAGLKLSGHAPLLESSFLAVEVDFDRERATIWFGPRQERLGLSVLVPERLAKDIKAAKDRLGSGRTVEGFLAVLDAAVARLRLGSSARSFALTALLPEIAMLLQPPEFRSDPTRERFRSYGRADFACDLQRLLMSPGDTRFLEAYRLVGATRADTQSRKGFLWVPKGDTCTGTVYSHLEIREG